MAMLPVLLGLGQKCPVCHQKSSPKMGEGKWEAVGLWNGPINRCTDCGRLIRVGVFSDELLSEEDSGRFLKARDENLEE